MAFFKYFLIRVAIFVPLFVIFLLIQVGAIVSAIAAAVIAFCVSYLFFRKQRDAAAEQMANRFRGNAKPVRSATELADAQAEDSLLDEHPDVKINADQRPEARASANLAAPSSVPREFLD
ncbi:MAG: DUF4229 domain-containing protein [Acidobacteria bacterium]|nr:DUF4229 domain-containing protein [Acidobacteriota bacterium]